jgi:class 3 adenylate cyclase
MTTLADEVRKYANSTFHDAWVRSESEAVPDEDDDPIGLGNKGVTLDAVVLYADMTDSTGLVATHGHEFAAEVYKTYVYAAAKAIRYEGGSVTAYDGDRVMGVFVGDRKRNNAVDAALQLDALIEDVLRPELKAVYSSSSYDVHHKVGIDASEILVANTGIRGNNSYTWVGNAANNAAKMAALKRIITYSTYITSSIYDQLLQNNLTAAADGSALWTDLGSSDLGYRIYGANARKVTA